MNEFPAIIRNATGERPSDVYFAGDHPPATRKQGAIPFEHSVKLTQRTNEIRFQIASTLSRLIVQQLRQFQSPGRI